MKKKTLSPCAILYSVLAMANSKRVYQSWLKFISSGQCFQNAQRLSLSDSCRNIGVKLFACDKTELLVYN